MTKKSKQIIDKNLLGIWKFDKLAIEDMKTLTRDTKYSGIEYGGLLCMNFDTKKIKLEKQCTGTTCRIVVPEKCEEGYRGGIFHTHPLAKKHELSHGDLINYVNRNDYIGCLGIPHSKSKKNNVICHTNKSNSDEYWNEKHKEKQNLHYMAKMEQQVELEVDKLNNEDYFRKLRILSNHRKYYQNKFLTTFNPEDYVSKE